MKYIQAYRDLGFMIREMTIQNEPLAVQTWDSCEFTAQEEKTFLRDYLCPALKEAGLSSLGIYIWDHNKERLYERVSQVLDQDTEPLIRGAAFHWYSGDHFETLQLVREAYPQLKLIHSEGCVELTLPGQPSGSGADQARRYAHDLIGDLNHGLNRWYDWNLVLDEQGGPNHVGNYCSAPIHCDGKTDSYRITPIYHAIGHFSRYLTPGSRRIATSSFSRDVEVVGALQPQGNVVLVAMNTGKSLWCHLRIQGLTTRVFLPKDSISTLVLS